jgi:hypothetical protein
MKDEGGCEEQKLTINSNDEKEEQRMKGNGFINMEGVTRNMPLSQILKTPSLAKIEGISRKERNELVERKIEEISKALMVLEDGILRV